jgi:hypothetical protein
MTTRRIFGEIILVLAVLYCILFVIHAITRPPTNDELYISCLSEGVEKIICAEYANINRSNPYDY